MKFKLTWIDGRTSTVEGKDPGTAYQRAGFRLRHLPALDDCKILGERYIPEYYEDSTTQHK